MINTFSDLLIEIMEKEKEKLKEFDLITHGPTIGDMYEGLTKDLLEMSLFKGLDIRVVSGFVVNGEEKVSNEVDCMIVEGEGVLIPHTDKYIYQYTQVIAVLEIKKKLYKEELLDSYSKMYNIYKMSEKEISSMKAFRHSFRSIVMKELPTHKESELLPYNENMIYHSLLVQQLMPLRIVFGYDGYKTHFNLREAFMQHLKDNVGRKGFSPASFPDLIVCGKNSLLKLNGLPYATPLDTKGNWMLYGSTSENPLKILLEFLWTRLTYKYKISSDIFGEDLDMEAVYPLLNTIVVFENDKPIGWEYNYIFLNRDELNSDVEKGEWHPVELTDDEATFMNILCSENPLSYKNPIIETMPAGLFDYLVESLKFKGLLNINDKSVYLLTDECKVVIVKGKWYAGEDNSGRLTRWIMKQIANK